MSYLRLLCVGFALINVLRAELGVGDSRDEVLRLLPKPTSMAKRGDREIFMYPGGGRIEFADGKVADIRGPLPKPVANPAPAAEAADGSSPVATAAATAAAAPAPATGTATTPRPPAPKTASNGPSASTPPPAAEKSPVAALEKNGVKTTTGPATVPLGKVAELKLPAGYYFVGKDSVARFYELTQNKPNGKEVGVVLGPKWMLFFDYNEIGYVKDEDKDKLDADKLMSAMSEGQDEANADRKSRGWDEMKLKGWATKPHYDAGTHNLKWAINLASSTDNYKDVWINESIRLLGRSGVMNVTLVTDTPGFTKAEVDADKLLSGNFTYVSGLKYSEFKAGDKIAAYGLGALVLGGAGVLAAKAGLLSKLGIMMAKAWKVVVAAVVGIGAAIKKLWNKISGAKPAEPPAVT